MVPGYDTKRPREEQYHAFVDDLKIGLNGLAIPDLRLGIFGSYKNGKPTWGRSDIDGILALPDKFVTNKETIRRISKVLARANGDKHIPVTIALTDMGSLGSATFSSYPSSFASYFAQERMEMLIGDNLAEHIQCSESLPGEAHTLAFNLRKTRAALFHAQYRREQKHSDWISSFQKSLEAVVGAPKQITYLLDRTIPVEKTTGAKELRARWSHLHWKGYDAAREALTNTNRLDELFSQDTLAQTVVEDAITCLEGMIKETAAILR